VDIISLSTVVDEIQLFDRVDDIRSIDELIGATSRYLPHVLAIIRETLVGVAIKIASIDLPEGVADFQKAL
jgi:hypothetical protein